jgi:hypothetical protein
MRRLIVAIISMLLVRSASAQSSRVAPYTPLDTLQALPALNAHITIDVRDAPVREVMTEIAKQARVSIVFDPSLPGLDDRISIRAAEVATARVIARVLAAGRIQAMASSAEAYDRALSSMRPRYVNATTAINPFPELAFDRVYVAPSDGRSRGVELSLARQPGRNIDWTGTYVVSAPTHVVNGVRVPRATDQPRAAHLDWSVHPTSNTWRLAVNAIWHSGWPYTPSTVTIDTIGTVPGSQYARPNWRPGALYSRRLPAYHRLDARWTRFFDTRSGRVAMFVDVYNLLNRTNIRDHTTNVSINRLAVSYMDETREQLPRIPSVGINWEF